MLLDTAWSQDALAFEQWKAILGKDATVAFRGPRVKMSIVQDIPTSIGPHPDTGRAMYHGPMAGRYALHLQCWHLSVWNSSVNLTIGCSQVTSSTLALRSLAALIKVSCVLLCMSLSHELSLTSSCDQHALCMHGIMHYREAV